MTDDTNKDNGTSASRPASLQIAEPGTQPVRPLPPLGDSFPRSAKIKKGELGVPFREIAIQNGDDRIEVYDTTGPQGHDPRHGLPKLRQAWIDARLANSDGNHSQMHYARQGVTTPEMQFVAIRENVDPE